ncbi:MFS transporter [Antrihabitans sp. YC2-6]|uniref:MFS transporter n=1 Tax=Antrihabitans sp. YC2-6 TaxID=2799498 RepID=UPI0018F78D4F|nr:MFS transporter [Antrihabitans sp. YC2-6]MBJ8347209.1 MFS transporter [Antrihabitans sp. YC2-6]
MTDLTTRETTQAIPTIRTVLPGAAMIAVTFGLARYGYGLLLPEMQSELALTSGEAGLIASGTYLSYLVANVGVVAVASRLGARAAIGVAAAFAAIGMTVIAVAESAAMMAVGILVAGAAAGFAFPPYADLVARHVSEPRRDLAWSAISSGTGWGVAIAGPIAIVAGDQWRIAWMVFVALAVGVGVVAVLAAPTQDVGAQLRRPQLSWTWFFCPKSRPLLVSAVLVGTGSAVWWAFSVDALRHAGLDATSARIVYAVCGVAGILASASGVVFSRFGLRTGYFVASVLLAGSLALLAVAGGSVPGALTAAILFGVCYNTVIAAQGIWSARVFAEHPSAGLAAISTALTIGTFAGPSIAGVAITQFGYPATLTGATAAILAALVFCPPSGRQRQILAEHQCAGCAPVRD